MILHDGRVEKDKGGDNLFFYSKFHPETILKTGILITKIWLCSAYMVLIGLSALQSL